MPILTMQQRARQLGRIRIGQQVTKNGKSRPEKLETFRITSDSKELLDSVASLYGGSVKQWTPNNGSAQWEVVTDAKRLPILIPPQPISQWFELWSGGGCERRCDGVTEKLSGNGCMCTADNQQCLPKTRLSVMLSEVPGLGLWRLDSGGYYAATEIPQLAQFLANTGNYVPAYLELHEKVVRKADEKYPRRFMVPAITVEETPKALLSSGGNAAELSQGQSPVAAIEAPAADEEPDDSWYVMAVGQAQSLDELRFVWGKASQAGALTSSLREAFTARSEELSNPETDTQVWDDGGDAPEVGESDDDATELWAQIQLKCPSEWTTDALESEFKYFTGSDSSAATASHMRTFLERLTQEY